MKSLTGSKNSTENAKRKLAEIASVYSKLTRKRNATNLFPRHISHVVLNGFIFYTDMLDCIARIINIFAITTLLPVNLPPLQKMQVRVVRSYHVAFRCKKSVYTCAGSIYLMIIIRKMDQLQYLKC